ncbi:type II toxin-antitoxin system MqsR family toxin [bacterium]|nr:type II toxin-antitoxin system MqsR family toxin [bacterium]
MVHCKKGVVEFLKRFKTNATKSDLVFLPRQKNIDFLIMLGMFFYNAKEIIFSLTELDYFAGPSVDDDGSQGEIYEFATKVFGNDVYIKLKLSDTGAKCISFHELIHPVSFPFKKGDK